MTADSLALWQPIRTTGYSEQGNGQTLGEAASVSIDKFVEQWRKRNNKPGVAVGITDKDRTMRVSTYGQSNIDAKIPPTRNTLFWIGSTGKSFACLLLLQLRDEGLVDQKFDRVMLARQLVSTESGDSQCRQRNPIQR